LISSGEKKVWADHPDRIPECDDRYWVNYRANSEREPKSAETIPDSTFTQKPLDPADHQGWWRRFGGVNAKDDETDDEMLPERDATYDVEYARMHQCRHTAAWMQGAKKICNETGTEIQNNYLKLLDCRKHWCPHCGGKQGTIHKSRKKAVRNRVDLDKYNILQFIFTVPADQRQIFQNRRKLSGLMDSAKALISRFYGTPVAWDRESGQEKKWSLDRGAISYLHLFGDPDRSGTESGVFHPHVNIQIFEPIGVKLKQSPEIVEKIKLSWGRALRGHGCQLDDLAQNVHISYALKDWQKGNKIKYMCKPWAAGNLEAAETAIKRLLVVEMKGFQYLRFWGALANCKYKDEMDLSAIESEVKKEIPEDVQFRGLVRVPGNLNEIAEKIDDGLYCVRMDAVWLQVIAKTVWNFKKIEDGGS